MIRDSHSCNIISTDKPMLYPNSVCKELSFYKTIIKDRRKIKCVRSL